MSIADQLFASPGLTVVDFTAAWCGPCRQLAPVLHEIEQAYAGRARVVEVDTDEEPALAQAFRVTAMPTVVLLRDGREVGRFVGARPKKFVVGVVERALAGDVAIASP
ncbi:MAG: thioredoxin family protein [Kofleriaceae bacterium]|nr:MAG: thioredoxin family protein [Kofleriaceae bacterium]MBZ0234239.1 thioredoxin family protein [Kofleriaceae bacterium]